MQVPVSPFLQTKKPWLKKLVARLNQDFSYASALGTDVVGKRYYVSTKVTSISDSDWGERGFVVRVYNQGRYFEYAFNELPEEESGITTLADKIIAGAMALSGQAFLYPEPKEDAITQSFQGQVDELPANVGPDKVIARLTDITKKMHQVSELVIDAMAVVNYCQVSKIFVSA